MIYLAITACAIVYNILYTPSYNQVCCDIVCTCSVGTLKSQAGYILCTVPKIGYFVHIVFLTSGTLNFWLFCPFCSVLCHCVILFFSLFLILLICLVILYFKLVQNPVHLVFMIYTCMSHNVYVTGNLIHMAFAK